jgi:hypothetical protein
MRIDSSGNLLVGKTATSTTTAGSEISSAGFRAVVTSNTSGYFYNQTIGTSGTVGLWRIANVDVGSITVSGSSTLYNVTSDQRLKENIQNADSASALIDSLQVRQFDWKTDQTHQRYGFVAQELVTVAPEAVYQPADPEEMMAVDYSKLVPMLVKEIQSLRTRIAALEAR